MKRTPHTGGDQQSKWFEANRAFLILAGIYLLIPFTLNTMGKFGLIDDSAYAWSAGKFAETGRYVWSGWSAMSLIGQIWLVGPLVKAFGLSFGLLRIFSLAMGLICLTSIYLIMVNAGLKRNIAAIATASIYACPVFFPLLFTFMTDISFFAFGFTGILLQIIAIKRNKTAPLLLGGALTAYSILIRQNGVFWCLALLLYILCENKEIRRRYLPWTIAVVFVNFATLMAFTHYAKSHGFESSTLMSLQVFKPRLAFRIWTKAITYIGLGMFPLVIGVVCSLVRMKNPLLHRLMLGCSVLAFCAVASFTKIAQPADFKLMPYGVYGIFTRWGGFYDIRAFTQPDAFSTPVRMAMTILSALSGGIIAACIIERLIFIARGWNSAVLSSQALLRWIRTASLLLASIGTLIVVRLSISQYKTMESIRAFVYKMRSSEVGRHVSVEKLTPEKLATNLLAYRVSLVVIAVVVILFWVLYLRLRKVEPVSSPDKPAATLTPSLHRFIYFAALTQGIGVYIIGAGFDRYFLPLFPFIAYFIARRLPNTRAAVALCVATIAVFGVLSWGTTHDVMAWSRTRDVICQKWLDQGVHPNDIEAGFTWNTEHAKLPFRPYSQRSDDHPIHNPEVWSPGCFPNLTGRYAVAYGVPPGYKLVTTAEYTSVIPPRKNKLYGIEWIGK